MKRVEKPTRGLGGPQRVGLWGAVVPLLIAPAVAMRLMTEVAWGPGDFAAWGVMLVLAAGAFEIAAWRTARRLHRALAGAAILGAFGLVWAQLAVGVW